MTSSVSSNQPPSPEAWSSLVIPSVAAGGAIVPAFYDMIGKSKMQQGLPPPRLTVVTVLHALKEGVRTAPTVSLMVGSQIALQGRVETNLVKTFPNLFAGDSNKAKGSLTLASSMFVAVLSSPFLAVYNGTTMTPRWSVKESLSKFSFKQAGAITLQETGFMAGLAAADLVYVPMQQLFGRNTAVEYSAAATAGVFGSLVGHAGNTALTRWQKGMTVDHLSQLSWGCLRKARGNAVFAVVYKLGKETLNSTVENER